jgi:hypothetical protein
MNIPNREQEPGAGNAWWPFLRDFAVADLQERVDSPELTEETILAWADAFHVRHGDWPTCHSEAIPESPGETWLAMEAALTFGLRGLSAGSTLARLLTRHRGKYNLHAQPRLTPERILAWADAFHECHGKWPVMSTEVVPDTGGMTWHTVNKALRRGTCGLPGGSSLARLLAEHRALPYSKDRPPLTQEQILVSADAFQRRTGEWPKHDSGPIADAPGETWDAVEAALSKGARGLPGGSSLARILGEHRGKYNPLDPPQLTVDRILALADAWHARAGHWPDRNSGKTPGSSGMTWHFVDRALRRGWCGLPGGSSLVRLLANERKVRKYRGGPPLTEERILDWADEHFRRTGSWPKVLSGAIEGVHGETWSAVDWALRYGARGLQSGSSIARLLATRRGVRNPQDVPLLDEGQIATWADAFRQRTGEWPNALSGPIPEALGETWNAVESALRTGIRGLPGGSSLAQLLLQERDAPIRNRPPELSVSRILAWADAFHTRAGTWPTVNSGSIADAPGETWRGVYHALYKGLRGLPGNTSLAQLLAKERGVRNGKALPQLTMPQILEWAEAHYRRTGAYPKRRSGPVPEAPEETWEAVDHALHRGGRGLPGGMTLAQLLAKHRSVLASKVPRGGVSVAE